MRRVTIVKAVANKTGLEQKMVARLIKEFLAETETALLAGQPVQLRPLGTLLPRRRRAKTGRNPFTNQPIPVPEHLTLVFKPSRRIKKRLNQ
ncbi:MAG: DNA-binding protein HU [candidate division TA06 bacterium ADurb.Bin417]|uniref:DNA-binding protein HU n=1 Tax=candidate division TA06 bacterium ADurb.Bin417 TaxID=1852828 RepID=A0A1V5MDA1_UNCT6|nr:MAG: DNA-binding protein HU [candidate division TA06 bacterium ADurb.Bin417]